MYISDLLAISVATLSTSTSIGADLYCRGDDPQRAMLFRGADYPMDDDDLKRLRLRGVTQLFIAREARAEYQTYLREIAAGGGNVDNAQRSAALNDVVLDVLATSFKNSKTDQTVQAVADLSGIAAGLVTRDDFAAADLFRVLKHDYATFTHSANVAYYAGILAHGLGYSAADVELIIAGGLLHDLGKLDIDDRILTKPGKLDDDEFTKIKRHPLTGFRQLATRPDLTRGQLMMVYQHHERLDGGGYPVGVAGDEIHPWAKLCAVVDIYEAVTSQRPYRTPMPRDQALGILSRDVDKALDKEMVECWISIIRKTSPD